MRQTIDDSTVRADLGPTLTPLPLKLSNFFLDHPDLSAFIVNRRGLAPYRIQMLGPRRSLAEDGDGSVGVVNLLEREDFRRVYYGEGVHRSLFFPEIRASVVIIVSMREESPPGGRPRTASNFSIYVRMTSRVLAGVVKVLRPFLQSLVIGKFSKAFAAADQLGQLLARDPSPVLADIAAFPTLFLEERRDVEDAIARLKPGT